jgi:hypothetical protein
MGSKALGICIKRHRGQRSQKVLADMVDRSLRWMLYVEAGKTDIGWSELVAIATALGPTDGQAFLEEATTLLYEEAGMDHLKRNLAGALQRRDFLGVLGTGAAVDMERLGRVMQGLGADAATVQDLGIITRWYASQSRSMAPGMLVPALQGHLRAYLDLVMKAPAGLGRSLNAGAAEVALLTGVLAFRLGHSGEALHYWLMASALAQESEHRVAHAYAVAVRATMPMQPSNWGGQGGNPQQVVHQLDQALAILGSASDWPAAASFHAWRAEPHAALGNGKAAARDLEVAETNLAKLGPEPAEDWTGLALLSQAELAADGRAACAVFLRQSNEALRILESDRINSHASPGWRAARMADLAAAYAQRGDLDHSLDVLLRATELALAARDPWRLRRIQGVRRRWLGDAPSSEALEELDHRLADAMPASDSEAAKQALMSSRPL